VTVVRDAGVTGALNWAACQLGLPTLADSGYEGAGQGIKVPVKQPAGGQELAADNATYNALHRATGAGNGAGSLASSIKLSSTIRL
jgi:hypothetical protein